MAIPYTDRLNYCSPLINNFGYVGAIEKLWDVEVTPRCKWIRTMLSEVSRIGDHITCLAAAIMEVGAMSGFLYFLKAREVLWEHIAHVAGARMMTSYARIGGLRNDLPNGWCDRLLHILDNDLVESMQRIRGLLDKNRIFIDRTRNVGVVKQADAINMGFTGPFLRSTGIALDCRKYSPYLAYEEVDFDVPVGINGDCFDRYYIRMLEIEQSVRIIKQCIKNLPSGKVNVDDPRVSFPEKEDVYGNIEAIIRHFKLIQDGHQVPKGETYFPVEGGNGEVGFYIVSDGSGTPYKVRVRPPSFILMGGIHEILKGTMLSDIVPIFGSVNMIGGECDR
jgi:NADH-quinone oxidoreductase subunit D